MSSDNVPLLQYIGNLTAGSDVYTEKVIAGQYNSLNIIVKSDVNLQIITEFSGDGTYWDYSVSSNVGASTNKGIVVTVQAKWIRLRIVNTSSSDSTYIRLYTYGSPTNSSVLAQLANVGNKHPVVDIGNLPNNFAPPTTLLDYKFIAGSNSGVATNTPFYSLYPSLYLVHSGASSVPTYSFATQRLNLYTNNAATLDDILDTPVNIDADIFAVTFSALFDATTDSSLGGIAVVGMATNFGDRLAVGYEKTSSPFTYNDWGIYFAPAGFNNFIPRTSFNIDKCDGSGVIPVLNLARFQTFQFVVTPFGFKLYIMYDGDFCLVHNYVHVTAPRPMFRDWSIGFFMRTFQDNASVATSGNLGVSCPNWTLVRYGAIVDQRPYLGRSIYYAIDGSSTSSGVLLCSIENTSAFKSATCSRTLKVKNISFTCTNGHVEFKIYLNSVMNGLIYSQINGNFSNARASTVGTFTTRGLLVCQAIVSLYNGTIDLDQVIELKADDAIQIETTYFGSGSVSYTFRCSLE